MRDFTFSNFGLRLIFALVLVFTTYNPTHYSYAHWLFQILPGFTPLLGISGVVLAVGWVIYIRASIRSIGFIGFGLLAAFFVFFVWLLIDMAILNLNDTSTVTWVIEVCCAFILAVGISWSHIRRRITGQVDTDDVEN